MAARALTLLPDPDSPTMASVSPASSEWLTPSTAFTTPKSVKKWTRRSRISSNGWCAGAAEGCGSGVPAARELTLPQPRIHRVAQTVPHEDEADHREDDRHAGEQH